MRFAREVYPVRWTSHNRLYHNFKTELVLAVGIAQSMEKNGELREALKAIKNAAGNTSWFRDHPHRCATASLPLAHAVACVEVASEMSGETVHSVG